MLSSQNINNNQLVCLDKCRYLTKEQFLLENQRTLVEIGDILLTTVATLGRSCIFNGGLNISFQRSVSVISALIENKYLKMVFDSPYFQNLMMTKASGTAQKGFYLNQLSSVLVPIPSLKEQKRIVAKVEKLLAKIDVLEKDEQKLVKLYEEFPGDMKASLLQSALQGRLVPQIESEGNAEDLYREIQKEKEHLVKAKVIKNEAALKPIKDDEIPFDIPDTWKWVRLNDLVSKTIKRGKSPSYAEKGKALVFAQKCNTKAGVIALKLAKYLDDSVLPKYDESEYMKFADIIINSTGGGTMGRVGFYNVNSSLPVVPDGHVTIIRAENMNSKYLYYYLKSCQSYLETLGLGSTNQTELPPDSLKELLIALPPLNEQNRIVAKLEELLPLCEKLTEIIA